MSTPNITIFTCFLKYDLLRFKINTQMNEFDPYSQPVLDDGESPTDPRVIRLVDKLMKGDTSLSLVNAIITGAKLVRAEDVGKIK